MATSTSRLAQQIKTTDALAAKVEEYRNTRRTRYKVDNYCEIIEMGCKSGSDENTAAYLDGYRNTSPKSRNRTQIFVTEELDETVSSKFSSFSLIKEEIYFLAICHGLQSYYKTKIGI